MMVCIAVVERRPGAILSALAMLSPKPLELPPNLFDDHIGRQLASHIAGQRGEFIIDCAPDGSKFLRSRAFRATGQRIEMS